MYPARQPALLCLRRPQPPTHQPALIRNGHFFTAACRCQASKSIRLFVCCGCSVFFCRVFSVHSSTQGFFQRVQFICVLSPNILTGLIICVLFSQGKTFVSYSHRAKILCPIRLTGQKNCILFSQGKTCVFYSHRDEYY